nr:choice-of-anchor tandem repeat NxxGxxAF-containing protein [Adhaeretor mobilis]
MNERGDVAFFAELTLDGTSTAVFSDGGTNGLELLARTGASAPGASSDLDFVVIGTPVLNDDGLTAFSAGLSRFHTPGRNGDGIYVGQSPSDLSLIAHVAHIDSESKVGDDVVTLFAPVINNNRQAAFFAGTGGFSPHSNGYVISAEQGSELQSFGEPGTLAPDVNGVAFSGVYSDPGINDAGQVAFVGTLDPEEVGYPEYTGVFMGEHSDSLRVVARGGDPAPMAGDGVHFTGFYPPQMSGNGDAVFLAFLSGQKRGVYSGSSTDNLRLVAMGGDEAPGFDGGRFGSSVGLPAVNDNGQVMFDSYVLNEGGETISRGIWAEDRFGILRLVTHTGDILNVSDDPFLPDYREVRGYNFLVGTANQSGRPSGFNNKGQVAFYAWFTDGTSGVFISNAVVVPEPNAGEILGIALLAVAVSPFSRRKR